MWPRVEEQLETLLCSKVYKSLLTDPRYRSFLARAGFGPEFPRDLKGMSQQAQSRFYRHAATEAHHVVTSLAGSIGDALAQAIEVSGPAQLYRAGSWWFTREVMERCSQETGGSVADKIHWLRTFLGLDPEIDWIAQLDLAANDDV